MIYDLGIIGGGPAGYSAALECFKLGLSVVLFEKEYIGGTCLNRGCVPTKFLVNTSNKVLSYKKQQADGISFSDIEINYSKTAERKSEIVSSLRNDLYKLLKSNNINIISGNALIKEKKIIECNGELYNTKNILIASGSKPIQPIIHGAITSDELLQLKEIPKNMSIIGGGTVAVEFASIFSNLGTKVDIYIRGSRILRNWDKEIAVTITQSLKKQGVTIYKNVDTENISLNEGIILSAIGRKPNIDVSEKLYFDIGEKGGILTDEYLQTKTKGIFAAGDVLDNAPQLAHISMEQGKRVVQFICGNNVYKNSSVVKCIFTNQEAASVGLTEEEAKANNISVVVAKQTMYSNARTFISSNERGFIKVIADVSTKKILGAHIICERAGDIISELSLAINEGLTPNDMLVNIRPHPSFCEAISGVMYSLSEKLK